MHLSSFPGFRVVFVIHKINLCWNLGCLGKERKNENWRYRRPEWATTYFESSIAIEKVCHDRVPLTLCCDRVIHFATRHIDQVHDWVYACVTGLRARLGRARDSAACASDRNPRPLVMIGFLCHYRVGAGNGRLWVAIEVFLVAT